MQKAHFAVALAVTMAALILAPAAHAAVTRSAFGKTPEGQAVTLFTITNARGTVLKMTDYGATVVALEVADRNEKRTNVVLGFPTLEGYLGDHPYFGATVGRYANRIAKGQFTLDGKSYHLALNNGPNTLHGGKKGFNRYVWHAHEVPHGVRFELVSPNGQEGYPGTLKVGVTYLLTDDDTLRITYDATTDAPTVLNLTNHTYWNLAGAGHGDVLGHVLTLASDVYLPVDDTLIPTGKFAAVRGTPFDFTTATPIGRHLNEIHSKPVGYDHCYVLRNQTSHLALAAHVEEPQSGRVMECWTTQPGIQLYTGNFLDGSPANGGFRQHTAFCLETEHYPDSPNRPDFPSTVLQPGETYHQVTEYRFSTR
ncbi:MAG: aldose epimerase family protein [Candidatus Xenobia bacterium]